MRNSKIVTGALALAAMLLVAACSGQPLTEREKGTGVGALLGAGTGAIIGAAVGHPAAGAAIGGGLGATGGAVVGNELQNQMVRNEQTQSQLAQQQQELQSQRRQVEELKQRSSLELNVSLKYGCGMLVRMRSCSSVAIWPVSVCPQDQEVVQEDLAEHFARQPVIFPLWYHTCRP